MNFRLICLIASTAAVSACGVPKSADVKTDTIRFEIPNIDTTDIFKNLLSCQKDETTQDLTKISSSNLFSVVDEIPNQNFEVKNCEGKTIRIGAGPIRSLEQVIEIPRPLSLESELSFVEISNSRTCKTLRAKVIKNDQFENYDLFSGGKRLPQFSTRSNESGDMKILLNDSKSLLEAGLNIADGKNLVTIKYFGECLELKKNQLPDAVPTFNCERAKEIGSQVIGLEVIVSRQEISGVREIIECKSSK